MAQRAFGNRSSDGADESLPASRPLRKSLSVFDSRTAVFEQLPRVEFYHLEPPVSRDINEMRRSPGAIGIFSRDCTAQST